MLARASNRQLRLAAFDFGTNIAAPPPRNPGKELTQSANAYMQVAPQLYALDLQYQPKYSRIGMQNLAEQMLGYQGIPGSLQLASAQRANDISDVQRYGLSATQATLASNPYLAGALQNLYGNLTPSPILQTLNAQANAGLQNSGALTPEELTNLDQSTLAGFAQRGQLYGNQSLGAQILNRDAAVRAHQQAAQTFAANVQGLNQGQNQFSLAAPGVFNSTLGDPFMAILGRPSQTQANQIPQSMFNVTSPYFSDLYNTNYNAQAAANISSANNTAALWGAGIKAVGSLAGAAAMSDRRVKKDIRDTGVKTASGIPLKTFRYRGQPGGQKFVGPMAQDVAKRMPNAVRHLRLPKSIMLGNRPVKNIKMVAHPSLQPQPVT